MTWILEWGLMGCMPEFQEEYDSKVDAAEYAARVFDDVMRVNQDGTRSETQYMGIKTALLEEGRCDNTGGGDPRYDLHRILLYPKEEMPVGTIWTDDREVLMLTDDCMFLGLFVTADSLMKVRIAGPRGGNRGIAWVLIDDFQTLLMGCGILPLEDKRLEDLYYGGVLTIHNKPNYWLDITAEKGILGMTVREENDRYVTLSILGPKRGLKGQCRVRVQDLNAMLIEAGIAKEVASEQ